VNIGKGITKPFQNCVKTNIFLRYIEEHAFESLDEQRLRLWYAEKAILKGWSKL